jgi:aspartyl-tRNA(Asn)/glutamyl-tRNA(Gln) amidotransferase subunit A
MDLTKLTIGETVAGLQDKSFSSCEVTEAYLDRIKKLDPQIHSYLTVDEKGAIDMAKFADDERAKGKDEPLLGVPLAIKDVLQTVGIRTTSGSKILENYQPSFNATAVQKLSNAGAIVLGKTNMDEFAMGASTENSAYGPTHNPWDTERVPGGTSGGSAAAVAADLCTGALGSDTGASIRYPAGFCGVVGLKPSYGRVSRYGLLAAASSTDVVGPMTKNIRDNALLLGLIAGPDANDQTTSPETVDPLQYLKALENTKDLSGMTFGVPREFIKGITVGVNDVFEETLKQLREQGAKIVDVELPHAKYAVSAYYVINPSEISANMARYDGIRYGHQSKNAKNLFEVYAKSRGEGLGAEVKRRIMIGTYALSHGYYDAYYKQAQRVRTIIVKEFEEVLKNVDAILTPTAPHVAFKIGKQSNDPLAMYLEDIFMSPASITGLPALSLPVGFAKPEDGEKDMPVGLQIIGRRFDEATILGIGNVLEGGIGIVDKKPKL